MFSFLKVSYQNYLQDSNFTFFKPNNCYNNYSKGWIRSGFCFVNIYPESFYLLQFRRKQWTLVWVRLQPKTAKLFPPLFQLIKDPKHAIASLVLNGGKLVVATPNFLQYMEGWCSLLYMGVFVCNLFVCILHLIKEKVLTEIWYILLYFLSGVLPNIYGTRLLLNDIKLSRMI